MKQLTFVVSALGLVGALAAAPVLAQQTGVAVSKPRWEFLVASGTVVPTGAQRSAIKRGNISTAQLHFVLRPDLTISTTVGWARSRDITSPDRPRLDIFTYDVGAEVRPVRWTVGRTVSVMPFVGGGAGARTYNHRHRASDATHQVAGYLSAGAELGIRRLRLRAEVRNYVTGVRPAGNAGARQVRNDVAVIFGIRLAGR